MFLLTFADKSYPKPQPQGQPEPPYEEELLEEEELASVGDEVSHVLTMLMPWVISVLLHLGLILLAFFVTWAVAGNQEEEEEEVIPISQFENDRPSELLTYSEDLDVPATTEIPREVQTQEVAKGDPLSSLNTDTANDLALIGVTGSKALPLGSRIGKDPFGVGMYGVGGNARNIAYVVDASGSLIDTLPFVINELKDSIRRLNGQMQKFTIIFFQRDTAIEVPVPHRGLKRASPEVVHMVSEWITLENGNVTPRGSSSPVKAIELALGYRPDLIYILSDNITGRGPYAVAQDELIELIKKTKQAKSTTRTKINTIQFLYPDPLRTLELIATENGGIYRFVDESVVGLK